MLGIPIVNVDPDLPVCPNCVQNVELDGGYIRPHGIKYNMLGIEEPVFKDEKTQVSHVKRERALATAFCRKSNRPYPGAKLTKDLDEDTTPQEEEYVPPRESLIHFLLAHPNLGYSSRDLAYVCDLHSPGNWKLDTRLVDDLLTSCSVAGLKHFQSNDKWYWAIKVDV